ncbi:MAG TPA: hypothetical protein VIK27_11465 [Candidatus Aquilonibacter sp.]
MNALIVAAMLAAAGTPSPAAAGPSPVPAVAAPAAKVLPSLIINGVLFAAVEYDVGAKTWRNLAIVVTRERVAQWRALSPAVKAQYAQHMIDDYRAGTRYAADIKLTFVDERNATLDQYLWTPPAPSNKPPSP